MAEYDTHIVDGKRFNLAWTKIKELFSEVNTNITNLSTAVANLQNTSLTPTFDTITIGNTTLTENQLQSLLLLIQSESGNSDGE